MMSATAVPQEERAPRSDSRILFIRGQKVLLDADLAELYGVETRVLHLAVRRHIDRFPTDFMFQLSEDEAESLENFLSKTVVLRSPGRVKPRRDTPLAFTEQGVAMVSSVLTSPRAIEVNIEIMRAFVRSVPSAD